MEEENLQIRSFAFGAFHAFIFFNLFKSLHFEGAGGRAGKTCITSKKSVFPMFFLLENVPQNLIIVSMMFPIQLKLHLYDGPGILVIPTAQMPPL
jgi:hypothetical protein